MKYIKKELYRKTKHNLRDKDGRLIVVESDIIENDELYERYKFMFDVLKGTKIKNLTEPSEELSEMFDVVKETIEILKEIETKEVVEIEVKDEEIVSTIDPIIRKDVLEILSECSTKEQVFELAEENNIQLDRRKRNVKKLKDEFKDEYEVK